MTPKERNKLIKDVAGIVLPNLVNDLYREGKIKDTDFNDKELIRKKLLEHINKIDFQIIIDHRKTILNVAEKEFTAGNFEISLTLFATFIEHTLNRLIHVECQRKNIENRTCSEIIKSVSIIGKCSWLLKLLGLPPIKAEYLKVIMKISEERNAYIHYKWKPEIDKDSDVKDDNERKRKERYLEIKKLLRYLKGYDTRHQFGGKKNKIQNAALK
jgi:hypothetical protein